MRTCSFDAAIEEAIAQAMAADARVMVLGEDVETIRRNLLVRFGSERVRNTPISESAFVGASVTMAMAGLRPIVEVMLVDFIGVAADALLNHAAKVEAFSGGRWNAPIVVRAACGGGYGDAGQHEQSLWGWLAHIPGLSVVVPSNPADAGALMLGALACEGPVVFLEHKLLSDTWLRYMAGNDRETVDFDVPPAGRHGEVSPVWRPIPPGRARVARPGEDITAVGVAVDVHRSIEAAEILSEEGISMEVIDLRSVSPIDVEAIVSSVRHTGRLIAVDEDYRGFGMSGEVCAVAAEAGLQFRYARVATETTIPYAREREREVLPNVERIVRAAKSLL